VLLNLPVQSHPDCFARVVASLSLPAGVDRGLLTRRLVQREALCSTALDHGFAVPHTLRTGPRAVAENIVAFARMLRPIPFGAHDGERTDLFFFVFAAEQAAHLGLLSKIVMLARVPMMARLLRAAKTPEEVVADLRHRAVAFHWGGGRGMTPAWTAFVEEYVSQHEQRPSEPLDHVASRAAELIAADLQEHGDEERDRGRPVPRQHRKTPITAPVNGRARQLAVRLSVTLVTEPAGVSGCLKRANRSGGFDWFRDRLEYHGFSRTIAWRLTLALHHRGLIGSEPNRPYLDRKGLEVAQRLLRGTGFRALSARDWEAALMLEADSRLSTTGRPARLEAEFVTAACAALASRTTGPQPLAPR
jgi:mannitol/fructose-specific phosphotransferase system IIA component (Ntr-type)